MVYLTMVGTEGDIPHINTTKSIIHTPSIYKRRGKHMEMSRSGIGGWKIRGEDCVRLQTSYSPSTLSSTIETNTLSPVDESDKFSPSIWRTEDCDLSPIVSSNRI